MPVLWPMMRSTVFMWRKRQSWKLSSTSTSFSHMSYASHQLLRIVVDRLEHRHEIGIARVRLRDSRARRIAAAPAARGARDGAGTRRTATARAAARRARRTSPGSWRNTSSIAGVLVAEQELDRAILRRLEADDVPSAGRNASYSDGVSVSSTAHCSNSCFWISLTRARILKHGSERVGAHVARSPP